MCAQTDTGRHANGHVEMWRPKVAIPVPVSVGVQPTVGAFVIIFEHGADGDAATRPSDDVADVRHPALAIEDFFGAQLDLRSRSFGDRDVTSHAVEPEPLTTRNGFVAGEDFGVAAEDLCGAKGWHQREQGYGES